MNLGDLSAIQPELVLVALGSLLVLADAFVPALRSRFGTLAALGAGVARSSRCDWIEPAPGMVWSGRSSSTHWPASWTATSSSR